MNIFILDGKMMTTIKECHQYLKTRLHFPDYYGNNLDALYDCLSEFDNSTTIIIVNSTRLMENLGEYGGRLISVFAEASLEDNCFRFIKD